MTHVEYWVTAFRRDDEKFAGEWRLEGISLSELRRLFHVPEHELMYGEYDVEKDQAERIGSAIGEPLDLERFHFQVGSRKAD